MSIERLNTYCIKVILSFLSQHDVCRFGDAFPEHEEAMNSYYAMKRVIDLDKITINELDILLDHIDRFTNVNEVKITKQRENKKFHQVPGVIAQQCSLLNVLDISGVELSAKDLLSFSSCVNLKSLDIKISFKDDIASSSALSALYLNNPGLESLCVHGCYPGLGSTTFQNLPKNLKKLELRTITPSPIFPADISAEMLDGINGLQLEKLWLTDFSLTGGDIVRLSTQTRLKSLEISTDGVNDELLGQLFSNNQELVEVSLDARITGVCLRNLPKSIKRLKLISSRLNTSSFIECFKTWKLESLNLGTYPNEAPNFVQELFTVVPTIQHFKLGGKIPISLINGLSSMRDLNHLKSLKLFEIFIDCNEQLKKILNNCSNLESLELCWIGFSLNEDVFSTIAQLPRLTEIYLLHTFHNQLHWQNRNAAMDYKSFLRHFSRCEHLTSVTLYQCVGFDDKAALVLVRCCKSLTKLVLIDVRCTANLVREIKEELDRQANRNNILYLTFTDVQFSQKDIPEGSTHPFLEVNFVRRQYQ